jgi:hypothetical protein
LQRPANGEDGRNNHIAHNLPICQIAALQAFRQEAYQYLGKARDATFELTDAILLTRKADSLADLSLCPVFRRQWSSTYEALQDTRPSDGI